MVLIPEEPLKGTSMSANPTGGLEESTSPYVPVTTYQPAFLVPDALSFIIQSGESTARALDRSLDALSPQYDLLDQ
jgi:hypothetical protein